MTARAVLSLCARLSVAALVGAAFGVCVVLLGGADTIAAAALVALATIALLWWAVRP